MLSSWPKSSRRRLREHGKRCVASTHPTPCGPCPRKSPPRSQDTTTACLRRGYLGKGDERNMPEQRVGCVISRTFRCKAWPKGLRGCTLPPRYARQSRKSVPMENVILTVHLI